VDGGQSRVTITGSLAHSANERYHSRQIAAANRRRRQSCTPTAYAAAATGTVHDDVIIIIIIIIIASSALPLTRSIKIMMIREPVVLDAIVEKWISKK